MPNFPNSLDDNQSLYVAVNNLRTQLTAGINAVDLTIPVVTTSGFPNNGFITVLSNPDDITQAEAIRYDGLTLTTFSGVERGAAGTPALAHNSNDNVDLTVVADHHNELKDAIIEIEKFIGVQGSENFVPFALGNNVLLPSSLSIQNVLTISGSVTSPIGEFADSLTISGAPVATGTVDLGLLDDIYVNVIGDTMTGTLEMSGNQVRHAGVVEIDTSPPSPTVQGLLWFDPSDGPASPIALPGGFRGVTVSTSSGIEIPDSNFKTIPFDVENYDNGGWYTAGLPTRLTVPSGISHVQLQGSVSIESPSSGTRSLRIVRNGLESLTNFPTGGISSTTSVFSDPTLSSTAFSTTSPVLAVTGTNEFFELQVYQNSGAILDTQVGGTSFSAIAVSTRGVPGVNSLNELQGELTVLASGGIQIHTSSANNSVIVGLAPSSGTTLSGVIENRLDTELGPVAFWDLAEDRNDSSGNSFDLTAGSDFVETILTGDLRGARIDSAITYSRAHTPTLSILGDVTVDAIIQVETMANEELRIFRVGGPGETEAVNVVVQFTISTAGAPRYFAEFGAGTNIDYTVSPDFRLIGGPVYHVVLVRENDVITFYVNGRQFGPSSSTLNTPTGGTDTTVEVGGAAGANITAALAGVRVFDFALSAEQVANEYNKLLRVSPVSTGGGGVSSFTQLLDTPNTYTGQGGKSVIVRNDELGLEFGAGGGGGVTSVTTAQRLAITGSSSPGTLVFDTTLGALLIRGASPVWEPVAPNVRIVDIQEDFLGGTTPSSTRQTGTHGWRIIDTGTATLQQLQDEGGHPGVVSIRITAVNGFRAVTMAAGNLGPGDFLPGTDPWYFCSYLKLDEIGGTAGTIAAGLSANIFAPSNECILFFFNNVLGSNWRARRSSTSSGFSLEQIDLGVGPTLGVWTKLEMISDGTDLRWYIDGTLVLTQSMASMPVPAAGVSFSFYPMLLRNEGTAGTRGSLDYFRFIAELPDR